MSVDPKLALGAAALGVGGAVLLTKSKSTSAALKAPARVTPAAPKSLSSVASGIASGAKSILAKAGSAQSSQEQKILDQAVRDQFNALTGAKKEAAMEKIRALAPGVELPSNLNYDQLKSKVAGVAGFAAGGPVGGAAAVIGVQVLGKAGMDKIAKGALGGAKKIAGGIGKGAKSVVKSVKFW